MRIRSSFAVGAVLVVGAFTCNTPAKAFSGEELAKDAKLSIDDARKIALKATAGTITDEELEKEKGGSGLRYTFDIKKGKDIYEVGVDAKTGKVLENGIENESPSKSK